MKTMIRFALLFSLAAGVVNAKEPFHSISHDEALKEAKEKGKLVFIDFFATWCGPCKMMDKDTFPDKKVMAWLKENTIAIKIDVDKEIAIKTRYKIRAMPTLVMLGTDGSELDRIEGYMPPDAFLEFVKRAASSGGFVDLKAAKKAFEKTGDQDVLARKAYARSLASAGKNDEALSHLLWCYDVGSLKDSGQHYRGGVVIQISLLGQDYPPARDALRERRDTVRKRVVARGARVAEVSDFAYLNLFLGEKEDTFGAYEEVRRIDPSSRLVDALRDEVLTDLLLAHRYGEILDGVDLERVTARGIREFEKSVASRVGVEDETELLRRREMVVFRLSLYYEATLGAGERRAAKAMAKRILAFDNRAGTYIALAWAGVRTGSPVRANLSQARKAVAMTEGLSEEEEATAMFMLAQVLSARGKHDQAITLMEDAIKRCDDPMQRKTLKENLRELRKTGREVASK